MYNRTNFVSFTGPILHLHTLYNRRDFVSSASPLVYSLCIIVPSSLIPQGQFFIYALSIIVPISSVPQGQSCRFRRFHTANSLHIHMMQISRSVTLAQLFISVSCRFRQLHRPISCPFISSTGTILHLCTLYSMHSRQFYRPDSSLYTLYIMQISSL